MKITEYIKNNICYLDGGMGTLLQKKGLKAGEMPEKWNITNADEIIAIHKAYFDSGSNIVNTNTFGANILKFNEDVLDEIICAAVNNAKIARDTSVNTGEKWIALDIGPIGKMLKPYGDLDFEDAVNIFAKTIKCGVKYGVDLVFIETMNDSLETKAAVIAAKENCDLPIFVSNAYGEDGKLMTGTTPAAMVTMLEGLGVDALGVNCSFGPKALMNVVNEYLKYSSTSVILKPNAGLPKVMDNETYFDVSPLEFAEDILSAVKNGVNIVGGCCGTTPEYIEKTVLLTNKIKPVELSKKDKTLISSYAKCVEFNDMPILIGERINPTGKKRFKQALAENDIGYILNEGISQAEKGVHILDVNVGLPEIDEVTMLKTVVSELQAVTDLPLQIDTSDFAAMETALRIYNGKAMINSVNGKKDCMEKVFPLAKKYGGLIVALTLDENGIPEKAEGRINIAKKILATAEEYGIDRKDIIFDPLALTVSADNNAAIETLKSVKMLTQMGLKTSLGVSNVSFGLPQRDIINSTFFALSLENGLSCAIMNPYSSEMMKAYKAFLVLHGKDENCSNYINFASGMENAPAVLSNADITLKSAIIKGLKEAAAQKTKEMLKNLEPLKIVNDEIIPALDEVGIGFENKTVFLPSLLMSAEAAKSAFEVIKSALPEKSGSDKCSFVIATVKGDIHDIGKNIVKLLLENYGFDVYDLGKDVSPDEVVNKVTELNAPIAGLSALMTTTVPAMEETIKLLRKEAPYCKIVVGGAVLNKEYAEKIGADKYAKDAMETVRYAEEINNLL